MTLVREGSPLFVAGIGRNDRLIELDGTKLTEQAVVEGLLETLEPGESVELKFEKRGEEQTVSLVVESDPALELVTFEASGEELSAEVLAQRSAWLAARTAADQKAVRYCPKTGQPYPMRYRYCPTHGEELILLKRAWGEGSEER